MSLKKENAFQEINQLFDDFANLTLHQLDLIEKSFNSKNHTVTEKTLKELSENELKIDKYEVKLSEKVINMIVLQQPMASDLRTIISCYRMAISLERIGDLTINLAKYINRIDSIQNFSNLYSVISNMLISSIEMVRKSILSFTNGDKKYAIWTIQNDEIIDEINHKAIRNAIANSELSEEAQNTLNSFINYKSIINSVERIADHATNIAEASIYSLEGKDIRHSDVNKNV